jgi:hypothetical protein
VVQVHHPPKELTPSTLALPCPHSQVQPPKISPLSGPTSPKFAPPELVASHILNLPLRLFKPDEGEPAQINLPTNLT